MHILLMVLSGAGFYVSLYFTLVYYRIIDASSRLIPTFCRMEKSACQLVVHHSDARVLGAPNSLLGTGYYMLLMLIGAGIEPLQFVSLMQFASWMTVALGAYLVASLFLKVKVLCALCFVSHAINLVIALLLTFWW